MINNYNSLSYRKNSILNSQEPDVVGNSPNSSGRKRTSWLMSLLLLTLMTSMSTWSQVANYSFTQSTGTFTTLTGAISGGGAILAVPTGNTISTSQDDAIYTASGFPFAFTFNGTAYTSCSVSTNGFITFGGTAPGASYYTPISGATAYNGAIAPWGKDANSFFNLGGRTGEIRWDVVGTSPNREIVIQWKDWHAAYLSSATTSYGQTYQVRLQENGNKVVLAYGPGSFAIGSTTVSGSVTTGAQIGLRGTSAADFKNRTNSTAVLFTASTAGATNTTSITQAFSTLASPPGMPSNGLIYTYAPPVPCTGTPAPGNTLSSVATPCYGAATTLSLQNATPGTGVTYQWYNAAGPTLISGATSATYLATNLIAPTSFYCAVTCSASTTNSNTITVTPSGSPAFPFTETFDASSPTASCWTISAGAGATIQWAYYTADATNGAAAPAASTRFAGFNVFNAATASNTYNLFSPTFVLDATPKNFNYSYFLGTSGYHGTTGASGVDPFPLQVYISVNGGAYTSIYQHQNSNSTFATASTSPWQTNTINLTAYAGQTVKFAFVSNSNFGSGTCNQGVDEIIIETIPTCFKPTGVVASAITAGGATITWVAPVLGTPVGYNYEVRSSGAAGSGASGLDASGSTTAPTVTAAVSGLTGNTIYTIYVKTDCGAGDLSSWTSGTTFKTLCNPTSVPYTEGFEGITVAGQTPDCMAGSPAISAGGKTQTYIAAGGNSALVARTGTKYAAVYYLPNAKGTFFSAPLNLTAGQSYTASIYYKTDGVAWPTAGLYYGTSASDVGLTTIASVASAAATAYTLISGAFIAPTTGVYYVAFQADNTTTNAPNYCAFDDFSVVVSPTSISSFTPATVCSQGAETVTINGNQFTGATAVNFNGVPATSFTVVSNTQITAVAPLGVTAGPITVVGLNNTGTSATSLAVTANPTVDPIVGSTNTICMPTVLALTDATPTGIWSSSNNAIATVDSSGNVSGVAAGSANILYTVTVSGCSTTASYPVTINAPVVITGASCPPTVLENTAASFSVTATGTGLTYQWQESTDSGATFNDISGETGSSYSIAIALASMNGYYYQCVVSGTAPCGPVTSSPCLLEVCSTGIASSPSNVNLCDSGSASFTAVGSGDVVSYQWYEDQGAGPAAIADGGDYSGATTGTLNIANITTASNGFTYYAVVTGSVCSATSGSATLNVATGVAITSDPVNATVCYSGGSASFTGAASGTVTGLQWQYSSDNTSFSSVANGTPAGATYTGATTTTLGVTTTGATPPAGTYYYRLMANASAPCPNVPSASAQLLINNPTITGQPAAATVLAGNSAVFTVTSSAGGATYQWQRATTLGGTYTNVVNGTPVGATYTGDTSASLTVGTLNSMAASAGNYYRAVATDAGCSVNSNGALLTINNYCTPTYASGVSGDEITNVTLGTLNNNSGATTAPWYIFYNALTVPSITETTSATVSVKFGSDGNQYAGVWIDYNQDGTFQASEGVVTTTSAGALGTANITINVPLGAIPGNTRMRVRGGDDAAMTTAQACGATNSTWGETEDYIVNIVAAPQCAGTPVAGTVTSSVGNVCFSGTATLTATGYSTGVLGISLQWYNSAGAISGANSATYTTPLLSASETYFLRVTCANGGATADSNSVTIGVDAPAVASSTGDTRCGTGTVSLSATASAGAGLAWYAAATGGNTIGTGSPFTTPTIAATTVYYVEANVGGASGNAGIAGPAVSTNGISVGSHGIVFTTTTPNIKINSVDVAFTGTGTLTMALKNGINGTTVTTFTSGTVTGAGLTTVTIPVGITVPTAGQYSLIMTAVSGTVANLGYKGGSTYPSTGLSGAFSVTSGYWFGVDTATNMYFFNLAVSNGCSSARTAVTATVTTPPALTISSATSTICNGLATTTPVTITSTLGDYTVYTWSPPTGVSGNETSGYTFNPTATTVYTLTGSNVGAGTCANTATHTVTVNALPGVFAVTPATSNVCSIDAPVLLAVTPSNPTPAPGACIQGGNGLYPAATSTATTCNGVAVTSLATNCWAGEYSNINVSATTLYVFTSSLAGDYVTITDSSGAIVLAYGLSPVTYYNSTAGLVRFYTQNTSCTADTVSRTRSYTCKGVDPVVFTPSTGLFTDAAGTVAYTGAAVTSVYAKPAATQTYTATATNVAGCIRTATATINVTPATTWYVDADLDGYGNATSPTVMACSQPVGYSAVSTDCNDAVAAIHPGAVDVCYDGIDNDCNGVIDNVGQVGGCIPIVTHVGTTQCGTTLATIDQEVFADVVAGAQGYRFKVTKMISGVPSTNPADIQTIDRVLRVFRMTQLTTYAFDTMYQVEVSIKKFNVWQPFYGTPCTVSTPAGITTIQSSQCGSTVTAMGDVIYANAVPFATGYRFRIIDVTAGGAPVIIDRALRDVRLSLLASPQFNTTYSIEVAVRNTDGSYLPYGALCNVTSPSFPTTSLQETGPTNYCDYTATSNTEVIYAASYTGATHYRFRFMLGTTVVYTFDKVLRTFTLSEVPGLTSATTYTVQVSIEVGGVYGPYGKACTLTTPGGARAIETASVVDFKATAYPNPFADNFKLDVKTSNEEVIQIRVYDMLGKLVEDKQVEISEIRNQEVGANYRSGVYNVIVTQGTATQTLRVIKR